MTHWILIADASGARIFATAARNEPLELVREIPNPQGRQRTQELTSDAPGRVSKAGAAGTRSATEPRTTAHEAAADQFARHLADVLRLELGRGRTSTPCWNQGYLSDVRAPGTATPSPPRAR